MKKLLKSLAACFLLCIVLAVPANAAGSSQGDAEEVKWEKETVGNIETEGQEDWYKFTTSDKDAWIHIRLISKSMNYAQLTLYDYNGTKLKELYVGKSKTDTLTEKLGTNETFYVCISGGFFSYLGDYVFSVSEIVDDVPDTLEKSRPMKEGEEFQGKLDATDDTDCFQFTVSSGAAFQQLQLISKEVDITKLSLYDRNGVLLAEANAYANGIATLERKLESGQTYYISIKPANPYLNVFTGAYILSWREIPDDAGDDMSSAFAVYRNTKYAKKLETSSDIDYYKFQTKNAGNYIITLKNVSGKSMSFYLYDEDGIKLDSRNYLNTGSQGTLIKKLLKNRTYYFRVEGSDPGEYRVNVNTGVSSLKLSKTRVTLKKGKKATVKAVASPSDAVNKKVSYSSANPYIASVNQKGVITGKQRGKTIIYCKTKDGTQISKKLTVTVK